MTRSEANAWILGLVGVFGSALGGIFAPASFRYAWLAALFVWLAWPLGSMALLFVHALTGGRWGFAIRPALVAGVCTAPLLLPAIIPYAFTVHALYAWLDPHVAARLDNSWYLNGRFFAWRAACYVIAWLVLAALALLALRPGRPPAVLARLAPPALIVLAVTVTFAAIDATLSLDPKFVSSAYGMIIAAEFALFALAIAALASAPFIGDRETLADIGKLMLALVVLWTYLDFMQLLIVWSSDLQDESPWYIARSSHGWGAAAVAIGVCHFGLPFFLLLSGRLQRSRAVVMFVAALLIAIEIVRGWWLVLPAAPRGVGLVDLAAVLAIGGIASGIALGAWRWLPAARAQHG
jgi:hypothetical protein